MKQQYKASSKLKFSTFGLIALTSFSLPLSASEFGDDFSFELPIVTSASRLAESVLNSASSVTVIDRDIIEASGFVELSDIFRLVPGFQVAYVNGHTKAVVPHGYGWEYPSRLQLLIDGRSTYLSSLSAIDWTALGIELEDIERIEVVRGPAASAYGSNSFAGAINIITREPNLDDHYHLRARVGNNNERSMLVRYSDVMDNFSYRISASTTENDGFDPLLDSDGLDEMDDDQDINNINISTRLDLSSTDIIKSNFSYTNGSTGVDEDEVWINDRDRSIQAISAHVNWSHILSDNEELKVNFFHNFREEDDMTNTGLLSEILEVPAAAIPFIIGEPDQTLRFGERTGHAHRSDLELQYSQVNTNGFQYVVGAGARYDTLRSDALFPLKGTVTDTSFRVFANAQIPLNDYLVANMGGLYEMSRTNDSHLSPKLGLNLHLSDHQSIRVSVARSYRQPSLLEQNFDYNFMLNNGLVIDRLLNTTEDLNSERIDSYELGYIGQLTSQPLSWEFKAYKEQYRDLLAIVGDYTNPAPDQLIRKVRNTDEIDMYGVEGEITYRPRQKDFIRFSFNVGHGSGQTLFRVRPNADEEYRTLDRTVPINSYGLLASKNVFDIQWSVGVYHVSQSEWRSAGDKVDAYTRFDASVSKDIDISNKNSLKIKLAAQNIGHRHYNEFMDDAEFEPRYFLSVSLTGR